MVTAQSRKPATKISRPWLTATCERLLRILPAARENLTDPLPTGPRRLLVVKVFGMGDSILIRSIVELLRERHPNMQIGVLVGPATREVMTAGTSFRVHDYVPQKLSIWSALRTLKDIRSCHYDTVLNCEQRSLAGSAFLALAGAVYHIGFIPISGTPKGRFLTHSIRFHDDHSVWQSFMRLARLVDKDLPERSLPISPQSTIEDEEWAYQWWREHVGSAQALTLALHVGSQDREFSRWPVQRFVEFAERVRDRNQGLSV